MLVSNQGCASTECWQGCGWVCCHRGWENSIVLVMALKEGKDKMSFVVTPLNLLGKQNVQELERAGLSALAITSKNANASTFKVIIILSH